MAFDYGLVFVKVGDKLSDRGIKDGMIADVIDLNVYNPTISDWTKTVYSCLKVSQKKIRELQSFDFSKLPEDKFQARSYVDLKDVEIKKNEVDLVKNWTGVNPVEPLDCRDIEEDIFKDITKYNFDREAILDFNAVSTGSYTYGPAGGSSYATRALAYADIANLTGNLTFTSTGTVSESTTSTITENIGAHTFTDDGADFLSDMSTSYNSIAINASGTGTIIIKNQNMTCTGTASTKVMIWIGSTTPTMTIEIYDSSFVGHNTTIDYGISANNTNATYNIYNNVITNFLIGVYLLGVDNKCKIENISFDNNTYALRAFNRTANIKNCVTINSITAGYLNTGSLTTFSKCASEDATGSEAGLRSITPANEFISLDDTDPDYLVVKAGGVCDDGGTAPSIAANTSGIYGNPRPHGILYSIGASELASGIANKSDNYYRRRIQ